MAHEIWTTLKELHDGTSDIKEQRYSLIKSSFDSFKMMPNELANDMYSRLNVIVNKLNALGLTKLTDADVTRKIMQVLPKDKYATIVTILFCRKDIGKMKPIQLLNKIMAHELSMKITKDSSSSNQDASTSSKGEKEALASSKKGKEEASSSSSSEASSSSSSDEDSDDEANSEEHDQASSSSDDEEEIGQLVKGVNKLLKKLNGKGVSMDKLISRNMKKKKKKITSLGCGVQGHYIEFCPLMEERRKRMKKERRERRNTTP